MTPQNALAEVCQATGDLEQPAARVLQNSGSPLGANVALLTGGSATMNMRRSSGWDLAESTLSSPATNPIHLIPQEAQHDNQHRRRRRSCDTAR